MSHADYRERADRSRDAWRDRQLYPEAFADSADEREREVPQVSDGARILGVGIALGWLCGVWTAFVAWVLFA